MTDQQPTASAVVDGQFIGPVQTVFAPQRTLTVHPVEWNAFDVPRMWDMVRDEGQQRAWVQARGWENLAQLLATHHDSLKRLRGGLLNGWNPAESLGAETYFEVVDRLLQSLLEDAYAHASTARGLDAILSTLQAAKEKIGPLKEEWDSVTTDWLPEWWDGAADGLNEKARQVMSETDKAVGDHRRKIIIPTAYNYTGPFSIVAKPPPVTTKTGGGSGTGAGAANRNGQPQAVPPPPVPGYEPIVGGGPQLEGLPQLVPAVPGSPISVLPVPPGNPYAPGGGAYVLPGPGVGRGGWIAPMPGTTRGGSGAMGVGQGGAAGRTGGSTAGGRPGMAAGMMPLASPMGAPGRRGAANADGKGVRDVIWFVAQGVDPVIGKADHAEQRQAEAERDEQEAQFVDWFGSVATPWSQDLKVTIKRRPEELS